MASNLIEAHILSTFVNEIELAKEQRKHTVAVFLDIQGAFDNIDPHKAIDVLDSWGASRPKSGCSDITIPTG
jgi:hypothetical protein